MNGILIKKKKLNSVQIRKLKVLTYIDSNINEFVLKSGVSDASIRKARNGQQLSEQVIDKIIEAL